MTEALISHLVSQTFLIIESRTQDPESPHCVIVAGWAHRTLRRGRSEKGKGELRREDSYRTTFGPLSETPIGSTTHSARDVVMEMELGRQEILIPSDATNSWLYTTGRIFQLCQEGLFSGSLSHLERSTVAVYYQADYKPFASLHLRRSLKN